MKFITQFLSLLLFIITAIIVVAISAIHNLQSVNPPEPPGHLARSDDCAVSEEEADVHYKEGKKNYEEAWVDHVNKDNTVQVSTINTKLSILFQTYSDRIKCFRTGSIVPVTVNECKKIRETECDLSLPHQVYVRTEPVKIIKWKYLKKRP